MYKRQAVRSTKLNKFEMAVTYYKLGETIEYTFWNATNLIKAVKLDPLDLDFKASHGQSIISCGSYDEAIECVEAILEKVWVFNEMN